MAQVRTAKEIHDELLDDLKAGTHTLDGRPVLVYDEFMGASDSPTQAGKLVVSIQYGGPDGGGGGLLREYAFDPAELAKEPVPEKPAAKAEDKPDEKPADEAKKAAK